jgi:hypothetical protein
MRPAAGCTVTPFAEAGAADWEMVCVMFAEPP